MLFLAPVAAGLITGTMITAIRKVHAPKGPWVTQGGYEYNAVLIAAMVALTETGPGRPSVDASVFQGDQYDIRDYQIGAAPRWAINDRVVTSTSVSAFAMA